MTENVCTTDRCSEKCNDAVYRVEKTEMILTPWWRELGTDDIIDTTPAPTQNYTTYDIYCLETKIAPHVITIDKAAQPCFISYEYMGVMRLCMNLIKGGNFMVIDKPTATYLQRLVDDYTKLYPQHCVIYNSKWSPPDLPGAWVNSVLPFLSFDVEYDTFVENGCLYIRFVTDEYAEIADYMRLQIVRWLRSLYKQGVVPLVESFSASIIANWELTSYIGQLPSKSKVEEASLFCPKWTDTRFASSMISFIYGLLQGRKVITLKGSINLAVRHGIAKRLLNKGFSFSFSSNQLFVAAPNLQMATLAANEVDIGWDSTPSRVAIILVSNNDTSRWSTRVHQHFPKAEVMIYQVADNPPYMLSWTIPLEIDSMEAARLVRG